MFRAVVEAFHKIEWRLKLIGFYVSHCKNLNNKLKKLSFCRVFFPAVEKLFHKRVIFLSHFIRLFMMAKIIMCFF